MLNGVLLALLLLTAGCTPFAPEPVEQPALPQHYRSAPLADAANGSGRWWEGFHLPALNRLEERLFDGNLDLRQALRRLEQLEAQQRISGSSRWPTLNLNGTLAREQTATLGTATTVTSKRLSLAAGYEVDLWQRLKNRSLAAELRQDAGRLTAESLLLSLSAQLADQYFLAAEQAAQLRLTERQIDLFNKLIETIRLRYRAGLASAEELYQAQQNLALAEARLPQYQTLLTQAENNIALLLGQPPGEELLTAELSEPKVALPVGIPASLLTHRPDVAAALRQLEAADRELAAALAARLPTIDLSATLYYSATELARGNIDGTFWSLALGLTQPLFDAGRRAAESDRQRAVRDELLAAYRQTILRAIHEVENSLVAERNNAERLQLLRRQLSANLQELQLARANYRSGLTTSSSLLNTEIRYLNLSSQTLNGQRQWLSDRIGLARALGGSWMAEEIEQQQALLKHKRNPQ